MVLQRPMENGWPECDLSDTERLTIPGTALSLPIQSGQPHAIMQAFFRDVHEFNEPCTNARGLADEGSWTENNSVYTSNHKGATAIDWNWTDHAVQIRNAGWNGSTVIPGDQVPQMRELLAWYEGMIYWGNDWDSFIDSMHFQMGYNTYGAQNVAKVQSFIDRKIRADGYSTYRRGGVPRGGGLTPANPIKPTTGLTAQVLYDIAGRPARMPLARYEQLLPLIVQMFIAMGANTIDRRAMVIAQLFHEAGCLFYTEEIADGSAYEGRVEGLGNTQPGDGKKFKGRGWIQLTGRSNYTSFSGWMFRNGRAPTPTYFVDNPQLVGDVGIGIWATVFYWTVSRPQLNSLADARNLDGATRAINGGLNGLEDRRMYYNRALAANANLLDTAPIDPLEELFMAELRVPSLSIYADPNEQDVLLVDMVRALDAHGPHEPYIEGLARKGDVQALLIVARTADGRGKYGKAAGPVKQATDVLLEITAANASFIKNASAEKSQ